MNILGFDPGKDKCGLAVMSDQGQILIHEVIESDKAIATMANWCHDYEITQIVMGNQTTSSQWYNQLIHHFPAFAIERVDERNSTLEARERYWQLYPPQGFQKLIPQGLRVPPRPVDDIVGMILIERYLNRSPSR